MSAGQGAQLAVLTLTLGLAVTVLVAGRTARRRRRTMAGVRSARDRPAKPRVAVVVNRSKVDDADARRSQVDAALAGYGWPAALWLDTTSADPGSGQGRAALDAGCDVVLVLGGDGTARLVAEPLLGTGVPLGLLPAGTGNLLARNLRIPTNSLEAALAVAVGGQRLTIDVGQAEVDVSGEDHTPTRDTFLVMAGLGFDAEVMASVTPTLKERVGWLAYVLVGMRNLRGRRTRVGIRLDDGEPITLRVRSVIVGNCGELTGGVQLLPEARVDDGWLDVVAVSPRNVVGWAAVTASVISRRSGRGTWGQPVVQHFRCKSVQVRAERPMPVQLDGDTAGSARVLRVRVRPAALAVMTPGGSRP